MCYHIGMARQTLTTLRVFAYTADDLPAARAQVEAAVERANRDLASEGIRLRLTTAADAPPDGAGAEAAWREIVRDADIAVLALWCRYSPLSNAITTLAGERERPTLYYICDAPMPRGDRAASRDVQQIYTLEDALTARGRGPHHYPDDLTAPLADHLYAVARRVAADDGETADAPPGLGPYLQHLVELYRLMEIPGIAGADYTQPPLEDLYVRLRFTGRAEGETDIERARGDRRLTLADVLPRTPLALTGAPGAGKTTILRYVALRLARHHLGQDPAAPRELGLPTAPRPVLFELRALTDRLRDRGWHSRRALDRAQWAALVAEVVSLSGWTLDPADAERLLDAGGLLLMFDGLDEVSGERARRHHAERLRHLATTHCVEATRVLVACRTRAWGSDAISNAFDRAPVEPLDREGIADFVGKWCRAVGDGLDPDAMTRDLTASPTVRRIATNPQMLTMLAVLYSGRKRLPQQRARLYDEAVRWLLERRVDQLAPYGTTAEVRGDLEALAWRMQVAQDARGQRRNAMELGDAVALLAASRGLDRDAALAYLRVIEQAVGLIVVGDGRVRFHHRTFQEYLCARRLAAEADPGAEMGPIAGNPAWVEVAMLTAGVLRELGEKPVRRFLAGLVGEAAPVELRAPRVGTAAACLGDLEAWGISDETRAPVEAALAELLPVLEDPARSAPLATRLAVAEGLGRTRDPRLTPEARWVEIPSIERVWDGVAPGDEPDQHNPPGEWHPGPARFYMQRWPVTVAEYELFVDDGGYHDPRWWSDDGWAWRTQEGVGAPGSWLDQLDQGGNRPVTEIAWHEAQAWCRWLTAHPGLHPAEARVAFTIRLPTALEWATAARAPGAQSRYPWGDEWDPARANWRGGESNGVSPVGVFSPAPPSRQLWDVAGNVWEWCDDAPDMNSERRRWLIDILRYSTVSMSRGGGWRDEPERFRVSGRVAGRPSRRVVDAGFRCVAAPVPWRP